MFKKLPNDIILIQVSDIDSNIYLIGDTVIDSGTGLNFTRLREMFRVLKKDMKDVNHIINTHGHFDHVGGNGYFLNAKTAIHEKDADILENANEKLAAADFFNGKMHSHKVDRRLKEGDVVPAGGLELEVIHTPGHTHGSICLYAKKQGILFTGDLVFKSGIGRVDFENSDPELMVESLEKIKQLPANAIYPGHGEAFDRKTLKAQMELSEDDYL